MVAPRNPALSCLCYVCNFCVFRTVTSSSHGWGFELPACASRVSLCLSFGLVCKWRRVLLVLLVSRYRGVSLSTLAPHTSRRKGLVFTVSVARSASVITCFSTSRGAKQSRQSSEECLCVCRIHFETGLVYVLVPCLLFAAVILRSLD